MKSKIGLLAGSDILPVIFAREARKRGEEVVAIAIEGFTGKEIEKAAKTYWIKPGKVAAIIDVLKKEGISNTVMQGKIPQRIIFSSLDFDERAKQLLKRVKDKQTQSLLGALAEELEKEGIKVIDARTHLTDVLASQGVMSDRKPINSELADIKFGRRILRSLGALDIGQSVVVKNGAILALEAIEGTDACIRRGAELGGDGVVVVKMAKANQDMRFDLPVVGLGTIEAMSECRAGVLGVECGKTLILEKDKAIRKANELGMCIVGIK